MSDAGRGEALVIGYGNVLRGDDGVGWHVADRLTGDPRLGHARVIAGHQLTPELAIDVSIASLVVLVDACVDDGPAGQLQVRRLETRRPDVVLDSHAFGPAALIDLTARLYGPPPLVVLVTVAAGSTEPGDELSAPVAAALPTVVDTVIDAIGGSGSARRSTRRLGRRVRVLRPRRRRG